MELRIPTAIDASEAERRTGERAGAEQPGADRPSTGAEKNTSTPEDKRPLMRLLELLDQFPANPDLPDDLAEQHGHYLYGTPRRK
ncbi:MAG TPA: hypothetical protein EYP56_12885 [Planctomycetaceae bacterium]|nr:hypothetical protein [Planctomycetaceae bacterium]